MKEWKQLFLMALEEDFNISKAARLAGVGRRTVYDARESDPEFRDTWDEIEQEWTDQAERELYRRAVQGTDKPVFYKGDPCGHIREYSDQLLSMFLRAHRPEKYREKQDVNQTGEVKIRVEYVDADGSDDSPSEAP